MCAGGVAANYAFSYVTGTLTGDPEDAETTYTGDMLVFTPPNGTTGAVLLRATLRDSSLLAALADTWPGDIRHATVTFKEGTRPSAAPRGGPHRRDGHDGDRELQYHAGTRSPHHRHDRRRLVRGHATGVVEVAQPNGSFVTGGGYEVIGTSGGIYPADPASRMNFGLNVQYNGNLKSLKGHVNVIFRAAGR